MEPPAQRDAQSAKLIRDIKIKAGIVSLLVIIMWVLQLINSLNEYELNYMFGLYPRSMKHIQGIICTPFLHASYQHISANSVPFIALSCIILGIENVGGYIWISIIIILTGDGLTWLVGRDAIHVGASGWIFGLLGYLLSIGVFQCFIPNQDTCVTLKYIVVSVVSSFFYGVMIFGIFGDGSNFIIISWEMHLFGLLGGIIAGGLKAKALSLASTSSQSSQRNEISPTSIETLPDKGASHHDVGIDLSEDLASIIASSNTSTNSTKKRQTTLEPSNPFIEEIHAESVSSTYGAWGNDV